ncbi:phosphate ABC transporter permease PstA [Halopelagius longus]|uniref:Phosphate transport system permease protein PstA n=1 Tax=Halopelagius longus TaxID=1236180 RepID=A0A1H0XNE9_9EURY|nr:phosphate ABC transporter permease PstA [Halopelagius longus]RDI71958.1 phosphate ABC transporter permease PstA [Halopelagius longus]SDQ04434.1 phosphate ABC transporter membrane protein 2, PhoT family [Halopelagius longus]
MAGATESDLVRERATGTGAAAAGAVGLSALLFALGLAALFEVVSVTGTVGGVRTVSLLGGLLAVLGLAVVAFGVGSSVGAVESTPRSDAGAVAAAAFSGVWFVVGGLVGSQTLGLGGLGWVAVAVLAGGVAFAVSVVPREDVGSTVPAGALALLAGGAFLTGAIGPAWSWEPTGLRATFAADLVVPALTLFCALLTGWAAAKAYGGFGAQGRHTGAYVLVSLNVLAIVSVLVVLVAFTVTKGAPGLFRGIAVGAGVGPETTIDLFGFSHTIVWPVSWPFVTNGVALLNDHNGVLPAIVGTVWLVVGAVTFAVPLGVGAAIYLTEYAERGRFTQVIEVATNGLWSTPSIVFGLFGFAFLVPRFGGRRTLFSGMLTLGFMLLPLVVITSREAMLAVPDEYRDASAALGVTKWQTVRSVVLPAALPGVVTGVILGVGRIAGETAPILLTMAGGTFVPGGQTVDVVGGFRFTASPPFVENPELMQATAALPYQLYALITAGVGKSGPVSDLEQFKWATALVLLAVVLSFYLVGIVTRYYFRSKLRE